MVAVDCIREKLNNQMELYNNKVETEEWTSSYFSPHIQVMIQERNLWFLKVIASLGYGRFIGYACGNELTLLNANIWTYICIEWLKWYLLVFAQVQVF
jgi:hypothetical protein